jgi:hypothetical protein
MRSVPCIWPLLQQEKLDVGFLLQQLLHHRQQLRALVAEGQPAAAAKEQFDAVLGFQVANLRGHRRLAQPELLGRLGDAGQAGDHVERLQLGAEHVVDAPERGWGQATIKIYLNTGNDQNRRHSSTLTTRPARMPGA